jgi:hypothetical protein
MCVSFGLEYIYIVCSWGVEIKVIYVVTLYSDRGASYLRVVLFHTTDGVKPRSRETRRRTRVP